MLQLLEETKAANCEMYIELCSAFHIMYFSRLCDINEAHLILIMALKCTNCAANNTALTLRLHTPNNGELVSKKKWGGAKLLQLVDV